MVEPVHTKPPGAKGAGFLHWHSKRYHRRIIEDAVFKCESDVAVGIADTVVPKMPLSRDQIGRRTEEVVRNAEINSHVAVEIVSYAGIENGELALIAGAAAKFLKKSKAVSLGGRRCLCLHAGCKSQTYPDRGKGLEKP